MSQHTFLFSTIVAISLSALAGCGDSGDGDKKTTDTTDTGTGHDTNQGTESTAVCADDTMRCTGGDMVQKCVDGIWSDWEDCGGKGQRCELTQGVASCVDQTETVETETSTDTQCSSQPDFTACNVVTDPDRSYDICVAGLCVSPGCGDSSCNVPGPHFPLADTNQRLCYSDNRIIACPNPGEDFYGQDAQYGWDVTHDETERYTRTTLVTAQPVVEDKVTGLVWQGCAASLGGADCNSGSPRTYSWRQAFAYCDNLDWGGHTDWRLPDPYELSSIVDSARSSPSINPDAFPGTQQEKFWSSSSHEDGSNTAWFVGFYGGTVGSLDKYGDLQVRCVRSGPFETRRFESLALSGDRVVRDTLNGLEWQGCTAGYTSVDCSSGYEEEFEWSEALAYCTSLEWGGYTDWRLPDRAELQSILDIRLGGPSIDEGAFPWTPCREFWSSSSGEFFWDYAWYVNFYDGHVNFFPKNEDYPVRCVRSGP
ncbi:MAG: DUF1566 domain-containing protein [Myxococcota bacterium]|jgi:hypothetical protein|nr:DUF1566 domain-containing protein [Myxococcota bacterium]